MAFKKFKSRRYRTTAQTRTRQHTWLRSAVAAALAVLFCWLFYYILDVNVLDYLSKQDNEADVVSYFYSIENRRPGETKYSEFPEDRVVIFNLVGASRSEITAAIHSIEEYHPEALVLDVIFPAAVNTEPEADNALAVAVRAYANIYAATRLTDSGVERSFFDDGVTVKTGLVNRNAWFHPHEIYRGDTLSYIPYAATGTVGQPDPSRLVNYCDKWYRTLNSGMELYPHDIEGKIVILGDLSDLRDTHDMSFPISGKRRVSGTVLMAHEFSTIIHDMWIRKAHWSVGIIVAFALTLAFVRFCYWLRDRKTRPQNLPPVKGDRKIDARWGNFIEAGVRIVAIVLLLFSTYMIFSSYGRIVNLVYAMISLALSGITMDMVELWDWAKERRDRRREAKAVPAASTDTNEKNDEKTV